MRVLLRPKRHRRAFSASISKSLDWDPFERPAPVGRHFPGERNSVGRHMINAAESRAMAAEHHHLAGMCRAAKLSRTPLAPGDRFEPLRTLRKHARGWCPAASQAAARFSAPRFLPKVLCDGSVRTETDLECGRRITGECAIRLLVRCPRSQGGVIGEAVSSRVSRWSPSTQAVQRRRPNAGRDVAAASATGLRLERLLHRRQVGASSQFQATSDVGASSGKRAVSSTQAGCNSEMTAVRYRLRGRFWGCSLYDRDPNASSFELR